MKTLDANPGLYVRPLFYDAISGEFIPPSDPQARAHTLGRLSMAAYTKGELVMCDETVQPYPTYNYTPSWAPVKALLDCDTDPETGLTLMRGLYLSHDDSGEGMFMHDMTEIDGVQMAHISGNGLETHLPLALGEQLTTAKAAITSLAQVYFTRIAKG